MRRNAALVLGAAVGAAVGALLARRRAPLEAPSAADERAEELRRKLAEARAATADEDDFEAAGSGAETVVEEPPPRAEAPTRSPEKPVPATEEPSEPPPADEFEAMRRRIHDEGRAAAEEMRRSGEPPDQE